MSHIAARRLEEKDRRRAEIIDAAEAVAAAVGIDAMTMDLVARQARLSRALLYVYFEDKGDLLFALIERALERLQERFEEAARQHALGIDQIEAMGRTYVAFSQEFPVHFEALALFESQASDGLEAVANESACLMRGDAVHRAMVASIHAGIADGSIRQDVEPADLVAVTLWGFMHGVIQLASTKANVMAHRGVTMEQLVNTALAMARRSLAPAP
ncbi:MAG: TetR/AcrR family transcriptional regulator [Steroidobacteraceae bacterium]